MTTTPDNATLLREWSDPKRKLTVEEAETIEDQARYDPSSMTMVLRGKARITLIREGRERIGRVPK